MYRKKIYIATNLQGKQIGLQNLNYTKFTFFCDRNLRRDENFIGARLIKTKSKIRCKK